MSTGAACDTHIAVSLLLTIANMPVVILRVECRSLAEAVLRARAAKINEREREQRARDILGRARIAR